MRFGCGRGRGSGGKDRRESPVDGGGSRRLYRCYRAHIGRLWI